MFQAFKDFTQKGLTDENDEDEPEKKNNNNKLRRRKIVLKENEMKNNTNCSGIIFIFKPSSLVHFCTTRTRTGVNCAKKSANRKHYDHPFNYSKTCTQSLDSSREWGHILDGMGS